LHTFFDLILIYAVEALLEVATQLGKKGWNRNMKLCNNTKLPLKPDADNEVVCNCSFPGGTCPVVAMYISSLTTPCFCFQFKFEVRRILMGLVEGINKILNVWLSSHARNFFLNFTLQ